MQGPDDVQRLRESLAKALRYAEVSRERGAEYERAVKDAQRQLHRALAFCYLAGAVAVIFLVWMIVFFLGGRS